MPYANNKGADQPAHPRSLISTFLVSFLDRIIPLVSISKISSLQLVSVAEQVSLCLAWSETPEDTFSHGVAQMYCNGILQRHTSINVIEMQVISLEETHNV